MHTQGKPFETTTQFTQPEEGGGTVNSIRYIVPYVRMFLQDIEIRKQSYSTVATIIVLKFLHSIFIC